MMDRAYIIEKSLTLFLQHGVKTMTITKIVDHLKTSNRTIYNHFNDKTDLLTSCLATYHQRIKSENETIIQNAENAIEAMGYLHQQIVYRSTKTNPNFFNDIIHYYPGLLQSSYRDNGNFAHMQLAMIGEWGIEDGLFDAEMDIDVTVKTVLALLELLKDTNRFPVERYSKERLTFGIMLPYLRGICTSKGSVILDQQETLFKIML